MIISIFYTKKIEMQIQKYIHQVQMHKVSQVVRFNVPEKPTIPQVVCFDISGPNKSNNHLATAITIIDQYITNNNIPWNNDTTVTHTKIYKTMQDMTPITLIEQLPLDADIILIVSTDGDIDESVKAELSSYILSNQLCFKQVVVHFIGSGCDVGALACLTDNSYCYSVLLNGVMQHNKS